MPAHAGIQSCVAIVLEILDSRPGLVSAGVTFFRGKLEIGHFREVQRQGGRCFILRAL